MLNLKCSKYEMHEDGIAFINLNNSPVNALSKNLISDLDIIINHIEKDDKCRLIIFRSLQKHFSAGADLKERKELLKNLKSNIDKAKKNYLNSMDVDELEIFEAKSLKYSLASVINNFV